jgi:outer membrane protein assembly factor BamD (BamD/ComL family)
MNKKQKPVAQKSIEPQTNERIIQVQNEAAAVSCEYKLDDYDIAELVFERYCDKFPDSRYIDFHKMIRVQRSDGKEFLVYYPAEAVTDNIRIAGEVTRSRLTDVGLIPL